MERNRTLALPMLALALCAGFGGCASTKGASGSESGAENAAVSSHLTIRNPKKQVRDDGRIEVQFELKNELTESVSFAWALRWFDAKGLEVPVGELAFERQKLGAGASAQIHAIAPSRDAVAYKLAVQ